MLGGQFGALNFIISIMIPTQSLSPKPTVLHHFECDIESEAHKDPQNDFILPEA